MESKREKQILLFVFSVLFIIVIAFAVDIEIKLYKLSHPDAVIVNTLPDSSDTTAVNVYEFHSQLTTTLPGIPDTNNQYTSESLPSEFAVTSIYDTTAVVAEPSTQIQTTTVPYSYSTQAAGESEEYSAVTSTEAPTSAAVVPTTWSVDADQNFYRTLTGDKYHKADCSYLSESRLLVTVDEIIEQGYQPCSRCMKGE